jgi:hypothetical protein
MIEYHHAVSACSIHITNNRPVSGEGKVEEEEEEK